MGAIHFKQTKLYQKAFAQAMEIVEYPSPAEWLLRNEEDCLLLIAY